MIPDIKDLKVGDEFKLINSSAIANYRVIIKHIFLEEESVAYDFYENGQIDPENSAMKTLYGDNWIGWEKVVKIEGFEL